MKDDDIGVVVVVASASTPTLKNIPATTSHTILNPALLLILCADTCLLRLVDVPCRGLVRDVGIFLVASINNIIMEDFARLLLAFDV